MRATGYRDTLVGENIAYGPTSADEVVAGWLHSPGHCENIMDPRFVEMGLALAPGQGSRRGLYWDQELARAGEIAAVSSEYFRRSFAGALRAVRRAAADRLNSALRHPR